MTGVAAMIRKTGTKDVNGDGSDVVSTYRVIENGKEFNITFRVHRYYSRTMGILGQEGILYVDPDDNRVHRQVVALGGGCGLVINDEIVEGLSPLILRAIMGLEHNRNSSEIETSLL
jgi:hypothetical protein